MDAIESSLTDLLTHFLVYQYSFKGYCLESALSRRTAIAPLENRMAKLENIKWQLYVKGLLFDYFSKGDYNTLNKLEISQLRA
jgi:hypothetical protein